MVGSPDTGDEIASERLWALHAIAVGLMERQVDRAWSTTQFFILLNATIIGGAFALLQMSALSQVAFLLLVVLLGGAALSVVAAKVAEENKRYYRRLAVKKTLIEEQLGLTRPLPGVMGRSLRS
jgi:VIT1/CCC1 family predicted Fe2+/Mn2+ transporter